MSELLSDAFKEISRILRFNDMSLLGGDTHTQNTSLDNQKHIDLLANDIIIKAIMSNDEFIGYISEEDEKLVLKNDRDGHLVVFDPVDGSKNVKSNITVGTIYSIYEYDNKNDQIKSIVESGYCLYGAATVMVKTTPSHTLEHYILNENNDFIHITTIENQKTNMFFSANMVYDYDKEAETFIRMMKNTKCTQRWIGSMVADCHQIILNGGTFIYPSTSKNPNGKIRLLYEAIPFSHIFSCVGGVALDANKNNIIDRLPFIKLKNVPVHTETPIILSTVYTKSEIHDIFDLNDIIKC